MSLAQDNSTIALPDDGRTITTLTDYLANNAVFNVKDFGAVGDGITDDTLALLSMAQSIPDNATVDFGNGTYLISYHGTAYSSVNGNIVMDFLNRTNITFIGRNATIKTIDHDIATYGGLRAFNFKGCHEIRIRGINFNMSFVGTNDDANYYPFCGAITGIDDDTGSQPQSALNGDFIIEDCKFTLFHPWGQFVHTTHPHSGDPNNGYKLFSVFLSGPYLATDYANQCRNVTIRRCGFPEGHNGYGFWAWAWNNIVIDQCFAESFVGKGSTTTGAFFTSGLPFIRYHQWYCTGLFITNNYFRARPCSSRTTPEFEGNGDFASLATNLTGDYKHGLCVVTGNSIILGNGDDANSVADYGVAVYCYGQVIVDNNTFDGSSEITNATTCIGVYYGGFAAGGDGIGSLVVNANTWGYFCSYMQNVVFSNGTMGTEYQRRCKSLIVTSNVSRSQLQYFLDMNGNNIVSVDGCRQTIIDSNTIDGEYNTVYDPSDTNSVAMRLVTTEATDQLICGNNLVRQKYYGVRTDIGYINPAAEVSLYNNQQIGVTVPWFTSNALPPETFPAFSLSGNRGDANVTLTSNDVYAQIFAATLTANRTVTLPSSGLVNGQRFRIVRSGLGAFTLDVGGLKTIPSATAAFVDVAYNGSAWMLIGYGTL